MNQTFNKDKVVRYGVFMYKDGFKHGLVCGFVISFFVIGLITLIF